MSGSAWACPSCGAPGTRQALYCARCGEQRLPAAEPAAWAAARRWWQTLRLLVRRPGALTLDHRAGRRQPRVAPLSLFLSINVAFFIAQALSGVTLLSVPLKTHLAGQRYSGIAERWVGNRMATAAVDRERYAERFDARQLTVAKASVIAMVPLLAVVCALLYAPRREPFATHWTFALHFYAFALLFMTVDFTVMGLAFHALQAAGVVVTSATADVVITWALATVFGVYVSLASRRVYGLQAARRIASSVLVVAAVFCIFQLHRFAVFGATVLMT